MARKAKKTGEGLRLDILDPAQRQLWGELGSTPEQFMLYGGTAIALRLGHRQSVDFDFFTDRPFEPRKLMESVPYLSGAEVFQETKGTLSVIIKRGADVKLSYFCPDKPLRVIGTAFQSTRPSVRLASLIDLAATKLNVVSQRASAKDYLDIHALATIGGIDLFSALVAVNFVFEGQSFNPCVALKALTYFGEMELKPVPAKVRKALMALASKVDIATYDQTVAKYRDDPALWRQLP